jgi:hypothetical protein
VHDDALDAQAGTGSTRLLGRDLGGCWGLGGRRHGRRQRACAGERERERGEAGAGVVLHAAMLSLTLCAAAAAPSAHAQASVGPQLRPLVGTARSTLVEPDETLLDVAYRERLGFEAVARLNPDVDEWIPDAGTVVQLPTRLVLPDAPPEGLVLNVPRCASTTSVPGPSRRSSPRRLATRSTRRRSASSGSARSG